MTAEYICKYEQRVEALTESTGEQERRANLDGGDGAGVRCLRESSAGDGGGHEAKDRAAAGGLGFCRRPDSIATFSSLSDRNPTPRRSPRPAAASPSAAPPTPAGADPRLLLVLRRRERGWDGSDVTGGDQNLIFDIPRCRCSTR
jgi:hypothetical protein